MAFKKWVKNIQTAGYNGARTVDQYATEKLKNGADILRNFTEGYKKVSNFCDFVHNFIISEKNILKKVGPNFCRFLHNFAEDYIIFHTHKLCFIFVAFQIILMRGIKKVIQQKIYIFDAFT